LDMSLSMPEALAEHLELLMPYLDKNLTDRENSGIRHDTLNMLKRMMRATSRPEQFVRVGP